MALERIGRVQWDQEHGAMVEGEFVNALFRSFHGKRVRITISELPSEGPDLPTEPQRRARGRPRMRGEDPPAPPDVRAS